MRNGFVGVATPYYVEKGIPYLQSNNVRRNKIDKTQMVYINKEFHEKHEKSMLKENDILVVQSGHAGECTVVPKEFEGSNCHALIIMSPTDVTTINSTFCAYYLNSPMGIKKIFPLITGNTVKHILASEMKKLRINLPSLNEQNKLSHFLSTIEKKIELLENKHRYYQDFKKYLMQQIFAQKLRFDKSNENQKEIQLDNVISIINKRNKDDQNLPVLSISNKLGFISQSEQFEDREVASSDKKNYKIVNKGEFAYNPARINVGSIAQLKTYEKGIISPMYIVFKIDSTQLNPTFFENFLDSDYFRYEMMKRLEGSVRMILSAESLKNIKITVPPIKEQENLSKVFLAFDKEIEIIKYQLEKMQEFKKGLLQQMFVNQLLKNLNDNKLKIYVLF